MEGADPSDPLLGEEEAPTGRLGADPLGTMGRRAAGCSARSAP
jgi:hypothetical protein